MYRVASHVSSVSTKALCETKFKNWQERNRWLWWEEQTFCPSTNSNLKFKYFQTSPLIILCLSYHWEDALRCARDWDTPPSQPHLHSGSGSQEDNQGLKVSRRKLKRNLINQHSEPFQSKEPSSSPSPSDCLSWSSSPSPSRLPQTPTSNSLLSTLSFRSSTILSCHSSQLVSKSLLLLSCHLKGQKV